MELPSLNFPEYNLTIKAFGKGEGRLKIFDKIRLKYVALTPEEWVRQHVMSFLTLDRGVPKGLIAVEKEISVNTLNKRFDALVYNRSHVPSILIECKAPGIALSQEVFDQAARYNILLKAPYLLVSNGIQTHFLQVNHEIGQYQFSDDVPQYDTLFPPS